MVSKGNRNVRTYTHCMRIDFLVDEPEQRTSASSFDIAQFLRDQAADLEQDEAADAIARRFRERARGDSLASVQANERAGRQVPGVQSVSYEFLGNTRVVDERMREEYDGLKPMWILPTFVSESTLSE